MMQIVLIGIGAGAASALLFASVASGSLLSFLLANFAQLPILIAAIGWTHFAGLTALLVASAGLAVVLGGWVAFAFLIGIGLPAWWIGYLALLARPAPGAEPADDRVVSGRPHRRVDRDRGRVRRDRLDVALRPRRRADAGRAAARARARACASSPARRRDGAAAHSRTSRIPSA